MAHSFCIAGPPVRRPSVRNKRAAKTATLTPKRVILAHLATLRNSPQPLQNPFRKFAPTNAPQTFTVIVTFLLAGTPGGDLVTTERYLPPGAGDQRDSTASLANLETAWEKSILMVVGCVTISAERRLGDLNCQ